MDSSNGHKHHLDNDDWHFDMKGHQRGLAFYNKLVSYNCRVILKKGAKGDELWRGTEEDMPFWGFNPMKKLAKDYVTKEEMKPAAERGRNMTHAVSIKKVFNAAADVIANKKHCEKHGRNVGLVGDEFPVSGIVQWYLSKTGTNKMLAKVNAATIAATTGNVKNAKENTKTNSFEFVSGCYSPSTRRLVFAGTHLSNQARAIITPDVYDIIVSENGQEAEGRTQCPEAAWKAEIKLHSSAMKYENEDNVEFDNLRSRDKEEQENFRKAAEAIEKIRDDIKRLEIAAKQHDIFKALCDDDATEQADEIYKELHGIAEGENDRLSKLIQTCMAKYQTVKERYRVIAEIEDRKITDKSSQRDPPEGACKTSEDKVRALLGMAAWYEKDFRTNMRKIVEDLNEACINDSLHDFCDTYGLDRNKYPFALDTSLKLPIENDGKAGNDSQASYVKGMFGGPKSFDRALVKINEGKSLKDLNRASLIFEDPYVMAICFDALDSRLDIVTVKNKFRKPEGAGDEFVWKQPPCLHLNVMVDDNWLVEVQLHLNDILTIKGEQHCCYDIIRSESSLEILAPLYKPELGSNKF